MFREYRLDPSKSTEYVPLSTRIQRKVSESSGSSVEVAETTEHAHQSSSEDRGSSTALLSSPLRRYLCPAGIQTMAASAVESLMTMPMGIKVRPGNECEFERMHLEVIGRPRPLRSLLEQLQEAAFVLAKDWGIARDQRAHVYLKGSVASAAVQGKDLIQTILNGVDIDLQMDGQELVPPEFSDQQCVEFAKRVAVLWICSLIEEQPAETVLHIMQSNSRWELPAKVFRHFFCSRKAITGLPSNPNASDCWALYGLGLKLSDDLSNHLDLTISFRASRPYVSDDAAFQVALPLSEAPAKTMCWIRPKEALFSLENSFFSVPKIQEVKRGALEKVLKRLSKGASYRPDSLEEDRISLVRHFVDSCQQEAGDEPWQKIGIIRLQSILQGEWSDSQRWMLAVQLVQIFPEWEELNASSLIRDLPNCPCDVLAWIMHNLSGVLRASTLAALAPLLSGEAEAVEWPMIPVWDTEPTLFLEEWLKLPGNRAFRNQVIKLIEFPAKGCSDLIFIQRWIAEISRSSLPGIDARLLLRMLANERFAAGSIERVECLAARCLLEIGSTSTAADLIEPWPPLATKCALLETILESRRIRDFGTLRDLEKRGIWIEVLSQWRYFSKVVADWETVEFSDTDKKKIRWLALAQCVQQQREISQEYFVKALSQEVPRECLGAAYRVVLSGLSEENLDEYSATQCALILIQNGEQVQGGYEPRAGVKEAKIWVRLLPMVKGSFSFKMLRYLREGLDSVRWGAGATVLIEEALRSGLSYYLPKGRDAQLTISFASQYPDLWDQLSDDILHELDGDSALVWLTHAWRVKASFSPVEQRVFRRWVEDESVSTSVLGLAQKEGWPLEASEAWKASIWPILAKKEAASLEKGCLELVEHCRLAQDAPPEEVQDAVLEWLRATAKFWVWGAKKNHKSQCVIRPIVECAALWDQKWGLNLLIKEITALWQVSFQESFTTNSRANCKDLIPFGMDSKQWAEFLHQALNHRAAFGEVQYPWTVLLLEMLAKETPSLTADLLFSSHPLAEILQNSDVTIIRMIWIKVLKTGEVRLNTERAIEIARRMQVGGDFSKSTRTLEYLEIGQQLVGLTNDRGLQIGWLTDVAKSLKSLKREVPNALLNAARDLGISIWQDSLEEALAITESQANLMHEKTGHGSDQSVNDPLEHLQWIAEVSREIESRGLERALSQRDLEKILPVLKILQMQGPFWTTWLQRMRDIQPGVISRLLTMHIETMADRVHAGEDSAELIDFLSRSTGWIGVLNEDFQPQVRLLARSTFATIHDLLGRMTDEEAMASPLWEAVCIWMGYIQDFSDESIAYGVVSLQQKALEGLIKWEQGCAAGQLSFEDLTQDQKGVVALTILEMIGAGAGFLSLQPHYSLARQNVLFVTKTWRDSLPEGFLLQEVNSLLNGLAGASWKIFVDAPPTKEQFSELWISTLGMLEAVDEIPNDYCLAASQGILDCMRAVAWGDHPGKASLQLLALGMLALFEPTKSLKKISELLSLSPNLLQHSVRGLTDLNEFIPLYLALARRWTFICKDDGCFHSEWIERECAGGGFAIDEYLKRVAQASVVLRADGVRAWTELCQKFFGKEEDVFLEAFLVRGLFLTCTAIQSEQAWFLEAGDNESRGSFISLIEGLQTKSVFFQNMEEKYVPYIWCGLISGIVDQAFNCNEDSASVSATASCSNSVEEKECISVSKRRLISIIKESLNINHPGILLITYLIIDCEKKGLDQKKENHFISEINRLEKEIVEKVTSSYKSFFAETLHSLGEANPLAIENLKTFLMEMQPVIVQPIITEELLQIIMELLQEIKKIEDAYPGVFIGVGAEWLKGLSERIVEAVNAQQWNDEGRTFLRLLSQIPISSVNEAIQGWGARHKQKNLNQKERIALRAFIEEIEILLDAREWVLKI